MRPADPPRSAFCRVPLLPSSVVYSCIVRHTCLDIYAVSQKKKTRSSADADNRLDAFSGQSRSTNMVPFHMLHIVSYFGRPVPPGRGSAAGRKFLAPPDYSQRAVFASL